MKKIMKWIMLFSFIVLLMSPGIASANLLVNPGFESTGEQGHMTGWTVEWNEGNIAGSQNNPHSGAWHARNHWDGAMNQDVPIVGGQQYRLTGWVYIPAAIGGSPWGSFIGVKFLRADNTVAISWERADFDSLPREQYNMGDSGWLTAPADAITARIRFGTWADEPWIPVNPTDFDDFDFSPIPEPMSFLLFGTGLIGLACLAQIKGAIFKAQKNQVKKQIIPLENYDNIWYNLYLNPTRVDKINKEDSR